MDKIALVAEKIKKGLRDKQMPKGQLANLLGVTGGQVTKLISGTNNTTLGILIKLENILGINIIDVEDIQMPKARMSYEERREKYLEYINNPEFKYKSLGEITDIFYRDFPEEM